MCADFLVRWHFSFFQLCFSRVQVSVFTYVFPRKSGEPTWPGKLVEGLYIWYTYIRMCTEHTLLSIHICVQIIVCISYYDMRTSICTHVEHKIYTIYIHIYIYIYKICNHRLVYLVVFNLFNGAYLWDIRLLWEEGRDSVIYGDTKCSNCIGVS